MEFLDSLSRKPDFQPGDVNQKQRMAAFQRLVSAVMRDIPTWVVFSDRKDGGDDPQEHMRRLLEYGKDIREFWSQSAKNLYGSDKDRPILKEWYGGVYVVDADFGEVAFGVLKNFGISPLLVNPANAINVGGGSYMSGSPSAEANLFRRSLSHFLIRQEDVKDPSKHFLKVGDFGEYGDFLFQNAGGGKYAIPEHMKYTDGVRGDIAADSEGVERFERKYVRRIDNALMLGGEFSRDFRDDSFYYYGPCDQDIVAFHELRIAADMPSDPNTNEAKAKLKSVVREMFVRVLYELLSNNSRAQRVVILPSLGTGVAGHSADDVAGFYREYLEKFWSLFEDIKSKFSGSDVELYRPIFIIASFSANAGKDLQNVQTFWNTFGSLGFGRSDAKGLFQDGGFGKVPDGLKVVEGDVVVDNPGGSSIVWDKVLSVSFLRHEFGLVHPLADGNGGRDLLNKCNVELRYIPHKNLYTLGLPSGLCVSSVGRFGIPSSGILKSYYMPGKTKSEYKHRTVDFDSIKSLFSLICCNFGRVDAFLSDGVGDESKKNAFGFDKGARVAFSVLSFGGADLIPYPVGSSSAADPTFVPVPQALINAFKSDLTDRPEAYVPDEFHESEVQDRFFRGDLVNLLCPGALAFRRYYMPVSELKDAPGVLWHVRKSETKLPGDVVSSSDNMYSGLDRGGVVDVYGRFFVRLWAFCKQFYSDEKKCEKYRLGAIKKKLDSLGGLDAVGKDLGVKGVFFAGHPHAAEAMGAFLVVAEVFGFTTSKDTGGFLSFKKSKLYLRVVDVLFNDIRIGVHWGASVCMDPHRLGLSGALQRDRVLNAVACDPFGVVMENGDFLDSRLASFLFRGGLVAAARASLLYHRELRGNLGDGSVAKQAEIAKNGHYGVFGGVPPSEVVLVVPQYAKFYDGNEEYRTAFDMAMEVDFPKVLNGTGVSVLVARLRTHSPFYPRGGELLGVGRWESGTKLRETITRKVGDVVRGGTVARTGRGFVLAGIFDGADSAFAGSPAVASDGNCFFSALYWGVHVMCRLHGKTPAKFSNELLDALKGGDGGGSESAAGMDHKTFVERARFEICEYMMQTENGFLWNVWKSLWEYYKEDKRKRNAVSERGLKRELRLLLADYGRTDSVDEYVGLILNGLWGDKGDVVQRIDQGGEKFVAFKKAYVDTMRKDREWATEPLVRSFQDFFVSEKGKKLNSGLVILGSAKSGSGSVYEWTPTRGKFEIALFKPGDTGHYSTPLYVNNGVKIEGGWKGVDGKGQKHPWK